MGFKLAIEGDPQVLEKAKELLPDAMDIGKVISSSPKLHIYPSSGPHGEVIVIGNQQGLDQLRAAISQSDEGLDGMGTRPAFSADGEGFDIVSLKVDDETLDKLPMPYAALASPIGLSPESLIDPETFEELKQINADEANPAIDQHGENGVHLAQMVLVANMLKMISEKHGVKTLATHQINAVIQAANMICEAVAKPFVKSSPGEGLSRWLSGMDTGMSSKFMACVMSEDENFPDRRTTLKRKDYPLDVDDFGRCYRLLEAVPEFRDKLNLVADAGGPVWQELVKNWNLITDAYKQELNNPDGRMPITRNLISTSIKEGQSKDKSSRSIG